MSALLDGVLYLRPNEKIKTKPLPNLNKKYIHRLNDFYEKYDENSDAEGEEEEEEEDEPTAKEFISEKQQEIFDLPPCELNIPQTLKILEK